MNTKLLRKIQKTILARPEQFYMDSWFELSPEIPECGTAACIAGWAITLSEQPRKKKAQPLLAMSKLVGLELKKGQQRSVRGAYCYDVHVISDKALDLTREQADRLYSEIKWPENFYKAFNDAETPKERAKVACERIDHFIKTKGAE